MDYTLLILHLKHLLLQVILNFLILGPPDSVVPATATSICSYSSLTISLLPIVIVPTSGAFEAHLSIY